MKNTINHGVAKIYIKDSEAVIEFEKGGNFPLRTSERCLAMLSDASDDTAVEILTYIDDIVLTKLKKSFGFDIGMIERDISDLDIARADVVERYTQFAVREQPNGFANVYHNRMIALSEILSLTSLEVGIKTP
ncbi:hypothetical protein [Vibrio metschnikovii]|uniref:hypothetical protein n=1 Tax=Vibrio metschnikovii TaxID=28172 RepID=UPI001C3104C3|nr:hypothetical protein [Vibrio metschnikovii]